MKYKSEIIGVGVLIAFIVLSIYGLSQAMSPNITVTKFSIVIPQEYNASSFGYSTNYVGLGGIGSQDGGSNNLAFPYTINDTEPTNTEFKIIIYYYGGNLTDFLSGKNIQEIAPHNELGLKTFNVQVKELSDNTTQQSNTIFVVLSVAIIAIEASIGMIIIAQESEKEKVD